MKYKIIDNFLDQKDFFKIKNILFPINENEKKFPWYYNKGIVRDPSLGPTGYEEDDWMYSHELISSNKNNKSEYARLLDPVLNRLKKFKIIDARANLLVPTKNHIFHEYHTDRKKPHIVGLLYLTTNNGFTMLKDIAKVDCIENRMLFFDGTISHCSVSSTDEVRSVINMNLIEKKVFNYH